MRILALPDGINALLPELTSTDPHKFLPSRSPGDPDDAWLELSPWRTAPK